MQDFFLIEKFIFFLRLVFQLSTTYSFFFFLPTGGSCQVLQHFAKINYVRNATRLDLKSSKPALNLDRPTCFVVCVYVDAHGGPEHERKLVLEWKRNQSLDRSEKFVSLNNLFGLKTKIPAIFKLTWKKEKKKLTHLFVLYCRKISLEKRMLRMKRFIFKLIIIFIILMLFL